MAPIEIVIAKIKAIADAIRDKTGTTAPLTLDEMAESIEYLESDGALAQTYILVDEDGYEIPAVLTEEEVELTATPNDIRIGTTAVTDTGVTVGEKEIPGYRTVEGARKIAADSEFVLKIRDGLYAYTRLQALFCLFNTTLGDSVATDKVAIDNSVYKVESAVAVADITVDDATESVMFNIKNDTDGAYVLRYFILKEEY